MKEITTKQRRFVEKYLLSLNATQACRDAGYSTANSTQAARLMKNPTIRQAIEIGIAERSTRTKIDADLVLEELRIVMTASLDMYELDKNGDITVKAGVPREYLRALSSARKKRITNFEGLEKETSTVFTIFDKVRAISLGLRHLGLLNDRLTIETPEMIAKQMIEEGAKVYDAKINAIAARKKARKLN